MEDGGNMGENPFKDTSFVLKFCECLLVIVLAIIWFVGLHQGIYPDVVEHLGVFCLCAVFYFFFPLFVMLVMYGMGNFSDTIYDVIICAFGAVMSLLQAIFFLVFEYDNDHLTSKGNQRYQERYFFSTRNDDSDASHEERGVICIAIFGIILGILLLVDAILGGLGKK